MSPDDLRARRVGVVMGGRSAEREVSLDTGAGVLRALRERGYDCVAIDWRDDNDLPALLVAERVQVVWNALHGTYGEDGAVQGLCACMGLPCTGSGILASALAMDKVASKRMFESRELRTPAWAVLQPDAPQAAAALAEWDLPLVVKPSGEGSSVGVTIVTERAALDAALDAARTHRGPILIERYIPGAEICVGVLDDEVLGTIEVQPKIQFYDYAAKYQREDTAYLVPPPGMDPAALEAVESLGLAAYRVLGCSGHARIDLRVDPAGTPYLLEVNTLPGMTGHSLLPKIAAHRGIDYDTLCERILALAQ